MVDSIEPFGERAGVRVVDASPRRVVVRQAAASALENHVGVRHASALHAAAYEAARLLVAAAIDRPALAASVRLRESDIAYVAVGLGALTTTAEPSGAGWDSLRVELAAGAGVALDCAVTTSDAQGKTVAQVRARWIVEPVI